MFLVCAVPLLNLIPLSLAYATRSWFKKRNLVIVTLTWALGSVFLGIYFVTVAVHTWIPVEMYRKYATISMIIDSLSGFAVVFSFELAEFIQQRRATRDKLR